MGRRVAYKIKFLKKKCLMPNRNSQRRTQYKYKQCYCMVYANESREQPKHLKYAKERYLEAFQTDKCIPADRNG